MFDAGEVVVAFGAFVVVIQSSQEDCCSDYLGDADDCGDHGRERDKVDDEQQRADGPHGAVALAESVEPDGVVVDLGEESGASFIRALLFKGVPINELFSDMKLFLQGYWGLDVGLWKHIDCVGSVTKPWGQKTSVIRLWMLNN